jgi:hypothetical protein
MLLSCALYVLCRRRLWCTGLTTGVWWHPGMGLFALCGPGATHRTLLPHWCSSRLFRYASVVLCRCEVLFGDTRVCTVQVYLAKQEQGCQGLYVVEFSREEMDIFAFKRMWEGIRARLSAIVSA